MQAVIGIVVAFFIIGFGYAGCAYYPEYQVYTSKMDGEAQLAGATYSKQVAVQTAQAKYDAAKLEAQTDVVRAEGVAKANEILAKQLGGPENYLKWKYIQMLEDTADSPSRTFIYVPADGGIPVTEAGRLAK